MDPHALRGAIQSPQRFFYAECDHGVASEYHVTIVRIFVLFLRDFPADEHHHPGLQARAEIRGKSTIHLRPCHLQADRNHNKCDKKISAPEHRIKKIIHICTEINRLDFRSVLTCPACPGWPW